MGPKCLHKFPYKREAEGDFIKVKETELCDPGSWRDAVTGPGMPTNTWKKLEEARVRTFPAALPHRDLGLC